MTVLASAIINRVRSLLVDEETTPRWTDTELLRHLSDGQRTIAMMQPDSASRISSVLLASGTRQSLPADGQQLLSIIRNMGTTGTTPGRAIRITRREIMDDQVPDWHAVAKANYTSNYMYDPQDATAFFVYPPSNGTNYVELNYTFIPAEITALTDAIELSDMYLTPLTDYIMFRAHQKDADSSSGSQVADMYLKIFTLFLQGSDGGELENNPNLQTTPFNPGAKGSAK